MFLAVAAKAFSPRASHFFIDLQTHRGLRPAHLAFPAREELRFLFGGACYDDRYLGYDKVRFWQRGDDGGHGVRSVGQRAAGRGSTELERAVRISSSSPGPSL